METEHTGFRAFNRLVPSFEAFIPDSEQVASRTRPQITTSPMTAPVPLLQFLIPTLISTNPIVYYHSKDQELTPGRHIQDHCNCRNVPGVFRCI